METEKNIETFEIHKIKQTEYLVADKNNRIIVTAKPPLRDIRSSLGWKLIYPGRIVFDDNEDQHKIPGFTYEHDPVKVEVTYKFEL